MTAEPLTRRRLLGGSLGFAAAPLCCTTPALPPDAFRCEGGKLVLDLARAPDLRKPGVARAVVDPARKLNLIVIHIERNHFAALDRSCTHGGAQCTYNSRRRTVQCTSVNRAEYDLEGRLLHGRTHGYLRRYPARLTAGRLEIALA